MKRVHIWENHVSVPHLDLVLMRPATERLSVTLETLARMGIATDPDQVEVHGHVPVE